MLLAQLSESFEEQKTSLTFLVPHPACTSPVLQAPTAYSFKPGTRKKLLVTVEDFWLPLFIRDGENKPSCCYPQ